MQQSNHDDYARTGGRPGFDPAQGGPAYGTTPGPGVGLPPGPGWGPQAHAQGGHGPFGNGEGVTIPKPLAIAGGTILAWTLLMGGIHCPPLMLVLLIGGIIYAMRRGMFGGGPAGPGGPWNRGGRGPWGGRPPVPFTGPAQGQGQGPAQGSGPAANPFHVVGPWDRTTPGTTPADGGFDPRAAFEAWHREAHAADATLGKHEDGEHGAAWPMV